MNVIAMKTHPRALSCPRKGSRSVGMVRLLGMAEGNLVGKDGTESVDK